VRSSPTTTADKVSIFNLLVIPGISDSSVLAEGTAYAERKRAFFIVDSPSTWLVDEQSTGSDPVSPLDDLGCCPCPSPPTGRSTTRGCPPRTRSPACLRPRHRAVSWPASSPPRTPTGVCGRPPPGWRRPCSAPPEWSLRGDDRRPAGQLNLVGINCLRQFSVAASRRLRRPHPRLPGPGAAKPVGLRAGPADGVVP